MSQRFHPNNLSMDIPIKRTQGRITIIFNPIAGQRKKVNLPAMVRAANISGLEIEIVPTTMPNHATELAQEAMAKGSTLIIAAGGDGTINEVAQALMGTNVALGIIPLGSGNGLARHLRIPLNPTEALHLALNSPSTAVDVAMLNGTPYLCTAGVGYDAEVAQTFAQIAAEHGRGFLNYLLAGWKAYNRFRPEHYLVTIDGQQMELDAFSITVANASQFGNDAIISRTASLTDGLLDVCIIKPFPWLKGAEMTFRLFGGQLEQSPLYHRVRAKEVSIKRTKQGWLHFDGEPHLMPPHLSFNIQPGCMLLVGKQY